jgi:mRNA-degrading endonuclease RelE of RelBE toxin-antitoxin system
MTYQVIISKAVRKQIDAVPLELLDRVAESIQHLAENPRLWCTIHRLQSPS